MNHSLTFFVLAWSGFFCIISHKLGAGKAFKQTLQKIDVSIANKFMCLIFRNLLDACTMAVDHRLNAVD